MYYPVPKKYQDSMPHHY